MGTGRQPPSCTIRGQMRILAIESSSNVCSVALACGGAIAERRSGERAVHSEVVLGFVHELLAEAGIAVGRLDALAFGAGPGGFTGLRLACGIAQGLAFGAGLPVVAVGSLDALALAACRSRVYACVDARMNEVYCGAYELAADLPQCVLGPAVADPRRVPQPPDGSWHGCGSGFAAHGETLAAALGGCLAAVDATVIPTAAAVARIALRRYALGEAVDAALAAPLYVRDKVALTTAERLAAGGER